MSRTGLQLVLSRHEDWLTWSPKGQECAVRGEDQGRTSCANVISIIRMAMPEELARERHYQAPPLRKGEACPIKDRLSHLFTSVVVVVVKVRRWCSMSRSLFLVIKTRIEG